MTEDRAPGDLIAQSVALILVYVLVMLPWFIRNLSVFGALLPSGGIGTAYLHEYNDIFSYPAEWDLQYLLDWGVGNILRSRLDGLLVMFQTWLAVEALIVLAPFALWALWKRAQRGFFRRCDLVCAGAASGDEPGVHFPRHARRVVPFIGGAAALLGGIGPDRA